MDKYADRGVLQMYKLPVWSPSHPPPNSLAFKCPSSGELLCITDYLPPGEQSRQMACVRAILSFHKPLDLPRGLRPAPFITRRQLGGITLGFLKVEENVVKGGISSLSVSHRLIEKVQKLRECRLLISEIASVLLSFAEFLICNPLTKVALMLKI